MSKKWILIAFILGLIMMCLLSFFGIFNCAGCSQDDVWDGSCNSTVAESIKDECCMEVRTCGGIVDNPSDCYTFYCEATGKMCVPEPYGETALNKYECVCQDAYVN